jgi:hypothetical protein
VYRANNSGCAVQGVYCLLHLVSANVGSNPARGVDVLRRFFCVVSSVYVGDLRRAYLPLKGLIHCL